MAYFLGLTGNIACGKSTVGHMLLALGATAYVDADTVVHELYGPGQPLAAELAGVFGPSIVAPDGSVDRRALGAIVFGDPLRLRQLEAVVYPVVREALLARIRALPPDAIGVLDALKLIESGYAPLCHGVWIVTCSPEKQLRRLTGDRGLTPDEARARMDSQPPIGPKLEQATEVITNDGSLDDLRTAVTAAWKRFLDSAAPGS